MIVIIIIILIIFIAIMIRITIVKMMITPKKRPKAWRRKAPNARSPNQDRLLNMDYNCGGFYDEVLG